MKKIGVLVGVCFLTLLFTGSTLAFTAHPHIENLSLVLNPDGTLAVHFQEAGLGHVTVPHEFTVTASVTTSYECLDANGALVSTVTTTAPVTATVTGQHNGQITLDVLLTPPGATCPVGTATASLVAISYSMVTVTDITTGATASVAGPFSL